MLTLEQQIRVLGFHNTDDFQITSGTPGFSSHIAYKVWSSIHLEDGAHMWDPYCGNGIIGRIGAALFPKLGKITLSDRREECVLVSKENTNVAASDDFRRKRLGILPRNSSLTIDAFVADVLSGEIGDQIKDESIDIIITDPPYESQEIFLDSAETNDLNGYIDDFLTVARRCLHTKSEVKLILDDDLYGDSVRRSSGYKLISVTQIDPRYRHRFLYNIKAI